MRARDVKRIVFPSTASVYGEPEVVPTPETCPFPVQTSLYAASKLASEGFIQAYCEGYGFTGVILRFVSVLGERYTHGHLFDFYRALKQNPRALGVLGNGKQKKSYVYVGDCVRAVRLVADSHCDPGVRTYNLGTDDATDVDFSIRLVCEHLGVSPQISYTGGERGWIGDSPLILLDTERLKGLGWRPELSIAEAVGRTLSWFDENEWVFESRGGAVSVVFTRAPLRLSLGGGGTDLPSYYRNHGGFLVAAALDKYMYMLTHTVFQRRYRLKYSEFEEVDEPSEIRHPILREALRRHWNGNPLEIASVADIPAGTGLGSSGAFAVCLLKALALAGRQATTPSGIAEAASHIEIEILGEPVGKQDTYVAAHGGVCAYTFHEDDTVTVEPLLLSEETIQAMEDGFLLFFTGETRRAVEILADQDRRSRDADETMLENLHRTKEIGLQSRGLLESGDLHRYAELMHEHWLNKRGRSEGMTTARADELYELARTHGAVGGKLVGAGGGGFLLVYSESPAETRVALGDAGAEEVRFGFDFQGCFGTEYR